MNFKYGFLFRFSGTKPILLGLAWPAENEQLQGIKWTATNELIPWQDNGHRKLCVANAKFARIRKTHKIASKSRKNNKKKLKQQWLKMPGFEHWFAKTSHAKIPPKVVLCASSFVCLCVTIEAKRIIGIRSLLKVNVFVRTYQPASQLASQIKCQMKWAASDLEGKRRKVP